MPRRDGPVFGIDIDGTLGEYHDHFMRFAAAYLGKSLPECVECGGRDHPWYQYDGSVSFAKHMGISKQTYRRVKLAYRRGGLKRSLPVFDGARELTVALRQAGARVIICTTRPYLSLDNVEEDSRFWLKTNRIQHDGFIQGEHKYRQLAREYGKENVVAVLDDLPEMCRQADQIGLTAYMMDRPHGRREWNRLVPDLPTAQTVLLAALQAHREGTVKP